MLDQLLTPEFWKSASQTLQGGPSWSVVPLLLIVGIIGWWLGGREYRGQVRGLQERLRARDDQLSARDERLQLARENEKDATQKWAVATAEGQALREQVRLYASKDDALRNIETSVVRTVAAIEQANTSSQVLGRTLKVDQPQITWSSDKRKPNE